MPLVATGAPLAARTTCGMGAVLHHHRLRPSYLDPPGLGIEFLGVAAVQHVERLVAMPLEVDRAMRMLVPVPGRRHEIGDQNALDLVAVLIALDRIADFARPEHAMRVLEGAVEPGID